MAKQKMNPVLEGVLKSVLRSGTKALGAAFDSVLEDIGTTADTVSARTKAGRDHLGNVGVGRAKRRRRAEHEDEE